MNQAIPAASDLWREPNKTDHLILPLVAGVLAHFVRASGSIASDADDPAATANLLAGLAADAERVLQDCREPAEEWSQDIEKYSRVSVFALKAWATMPFWMPVMYAVWKFRDGGTGRDATIVKWLRANTSAPRRWSISRVPLTFLATYNDMRYNCQCNSAGVSL